jgi:signal transduction histidine kinase
MPVEATQSRDLRLRAFLARRLRPLLVVVVAVCGLSTPVAYFSVATSSLRARAEAVAEEAARELARGAAEAPDLWRYQVPKLLEGVRVDRSRVGVRRIDVVDVLGSAVEPIAAPVLAELRRDRTLLWLSAEIPGSERPVGTVWVAVSYGEVEEAAWMLALLFTLLGVGLALLLHELPRRAMASAEARIGGLIENLRSSREELATLAQDLESQVAARSAELRHALDVLRSDEQRLRELSSRAVDMQESERRAIARELHDSVGQALTAIRLQLQVLGASGVPGAAGAVERMLGLVDGSLGEIRRAVQRLGPAVLEDLALDEALRRLVDDFPSTTQRVLRLRLADVTLAPALETTCYRVVQEALTNVMRHAEASRVEVEVIADAASLRVEVRDDGRGLPVGEAATEQGSGLAGMEERVELLGGRLIVESAPGRGTVVRAELPLDPRREAEREAPHAAMLDSPS